MLNDVGFLKMTSEPAKSHEKQNNIIEIVSLLLRKLIVFSTWKKKYRSKSRWKNSLKVIFSHLNAMGEDIFQGSSVNPLDLNLLSFHVFSQLRAFQ